MINEKCRPKNCGKIVYLLFVFLFLASMANAQSIANQLSDIEAKLFLERTEGLIKGYIDNLATIGQLDNQNDKDLFIGNLVVSTFENERVRIYNDIDVTGSTQSDFDIKTYLDNISMFYGTSDVSFEIKHISLSKIFYSADFYFIKAEVVRQMNINNGDQTKIDTAVLDIYVKYTPSKPEPRIYSIKKHENTNDKFTLATVLAPNVNETINNDQVMFNQPVPDIKPGEFYINTFPDGATVEFTDYPDFGKKLTPATIKIPSTKYNIKVSKIEYETQDVQINVGVDKSASFKLVPTFAYLNLEILPVNADVTVNGVKTPFLNGNQWDLKVPKGNSVVEISAEHYHPKKIEGITLAGEIKTVEENLVPKMGSLTINADNLDANNATVSIDNVKVGSIPMQSFPILEGKHTVTIEKAKLTTIAKIVDIKEDDNSVLKIALYAAVKTTITTDPSGAHIFIDDKEIGTSNLNAKLSIGSHSIRIVKDYHETKSENIVIHEYDQTSKFSYTLVPLKYSVNVSSRPSDAEVYFDGSLKGTTPLTVETTQGLHKFKIKRKRYFTRSFPKSVDASGETKIKKVLYPKNLYNLNVMYGINSFGVGLGFTISYFSMSGDIFPKIKNDVFTTSKPLMYPDTKFAFNSEYNATTDEKISISDSSGFGWDIKAGFVLLQPFMMRIHVGYGVRGFRYYEVYRMIKDATVQGTTNELKEGDLIKSNVVKKKTFNSFLVGIEIPIRHLNFGADYWFNTEKGPGIASFVFRVGFNLY